MGWEVGRQGGMEGNDVACVGGSFVIPEMGCLGFDDDHVLRLVTG
jgi:hypothetical protein